MIACKNRKKRSAYKKVFKEFESKLTHSLHRPQNLRVDGASKAGERATLPRVAAVFAHPALSMSSIFTELLSSVA